MTGTKLGKNEMIFFGSLNASLLQHSQASNPKTSGGLLSRQM
jgi:hypothetical protein